MINFLTQMIGPFPLWAWLGIGAAGVAVALFLRGRSSSSGGASALGSSAASQSSVDTSQLDPYTGVPYSIESATNPATGLPAYYGSGQTVDTTGNGQPIPPAPKPTPTPTPTPTPKPVPTPTPTPHPAAPHVRARGSNPAYYGWDKNEPQGVPLRKTPQGGSAGYAAYGSNLTITGPGVQGTSNTPKGVPGSTLWYPVQGGAYISASDVVMPAAQTRTGTGPIDQATPFWPVATDLGRTH